MNKNVLYIGIAVIAGLFAGYLIFGGSTKTSTTNTVNSNISEDHNHSGESVAQMWTCSMHPQILQPEPGDCPICGMDLITAETSADGLALNEIKMTKNAMALANVQTIKVGTTTSDSENIISISGKIKMNEESNAIQASYFDGRIERLNIDYVGQEVKKGQLLATIYAPNLVTAQQELITAASLKETQQELYKAVRNKLQLWKLTERQINSIEDTGKVLENFPIYATVSGTVSEKLASEGDYVKQGLPILKVSNLNSVWAEFDVYENQIAQFKVGQKIKIISNAYPNKVFDASVSFIDPVLNTRTRTVAIRAVLQNDDRLFKPGMFVSGKIESFTTSPSGQLSIPATAVMWTGERSLVYIKTNPNEPVFKMREITLGNRNGDAFTVVSGLENGDEIVTNGTFTVDAAAQLQGKKSMMNKDKMTTEPEAPVMKITLPQAFQISFKDAIDHYIDMKNAFVEGNSEQVSALAKSTSQKLKSITKDGLGKMEKAHLTKSIEMLDAIGDNPDLENQRSLFVILNENFVPLAKNTKGLSEKLYVQKCPMADNNKGAFWLSNQKEIRNPYYGEQMMSCGSIIDSVQ
ncbi:efflux RND transporter periplasmic adaptor subunit [Arenibacter sp. S6351L]|uniref:efflux RND transporter periplasmic adaptor subunit n=1 Tax=Arenibacter sp. S6351L TaxID=2926407 RepID=UPI001FF66786|nr:efflux RND transporter periplasmic adaptor subunit [Arenibacter sp. S6351L]MCK0133568.1 efflux RND transporter periplasmic adaptor subunit [Arenibacter sp. S6351L]